MELQRLPTKDFLSLKRSLRQIGFLKHDHDDDSDLAAAFVKCFAHVLVRPPGKAECRFDSTTETMHLRYLSNQLVPLNNWFAIAIHVSTCK